MIIKKLTSLEALGVAIRSEIDAQAIYREMAQRVTNPSSKERFHILESEEEQHQNILERKYNKLFPHVPLKVPHTLLPAKAADAELRKDLNLREVLEIAIQEERHSRDFYSDAATRIDDLSGRAMLKFLADMEYSHMMSLTAEYDLLVKYPHYYEDVEEPWHEEPRLRKVKP